MKQALTAMTAAILFSTGSGIPVLAQGFVDAAGFRGAGGFGAGIGAAAGTSKAKQINSTSTSSSTKLNQVAGSKYLQANQLEKVGKLAEAAALLARYAAERQQLYGPGDTEVLKSYDRAAALALRAGKKADAEKYMRSALIVCQRTSGSASPEARQRMAKLGDTLPGVTAPETSPSSPTSPPENPVTKQDQAQAPKSDAAAAKP